MKNRSTPFIPVYFILFIIITAFHGTSSAVAGGQPQFIAEDIPQFYTIQAGSYRAEDRAQKKYQDLAGTLQDDQLDFLRIERVGSYYTVRLGKFDSRNELKSLLGQADEQLPGAVILQAYILEERITRMYQPAGVGLAVQEQDEIVTKEELEPPVVAEQSPEIGESPSTPAEPSLPETGELSEYYTIQTDSYSIKEAAEKRYQDLAALLADDQLDYLRIERVGSYYTVRLGKFESRDAAEELLGQVGGLLPGAVILQAYIKEERILAMVEPAAESAVAYEPEPADIPIEKEKGAAEKLPAEREAIETVPEVAPAEMDVAPPAEFAEAERLEQLQGIEPVVSPSVPELPDKDTQSVPEPEPTVEKDTGDTTTGGVQKSVLEGYGQPTGILPTRVVKVFSKAMFGDKYRYPLVVGYDRYMGEIYVIGGAGMHPSSRVVIYGPDYFPVASLGDGRKVFTPRGLAIDQEGRIFIIQSRIHEKPNRLTILNGAFFPENEIFLDQSIPGMPEEFDPKSIALSEKNIYIVGNHQPGVLVLDRQDKSFQGWLVPKNVKGRAELGSDPRDPQALLLNDVVVDGNGRIYILCPEWGKIVVLDENHELLLTLGSKGGSSGKLSQPRSLAVDAQREIVYVVDYMRHAVVVYNYNDGKFLFEIGGLGYEPGWFAYPTHIEVDRNHNLLVADYFNHRIQVLFIP